MQTSFWKFAAIAGVLGIGLLVVVQAQRSLSKPDANEQLSDFQPFNGHEGEASPPGDSSGISLGEGGELPPQDQFEPAVTKEDASETMEEMIAANAAGRGNGQQKPIGGEFNEAVLFPQNSQSNIRDVNPFQRTRPSERAENQTASFQEFEKSGEEIGTQGLRQVAGTQPESLAPISSEEPRLFPADVNARPLDSKTNEAVDPTLFSPKSEIQPVAGEDSAPTKGSDLSVPNHSEPSPFETMQSPTGPGTSFSELVEGSFPAADGDNRQSSNVESSGSLAPNPFAAPNTGFHANEVEELPEPDGEMPLPTPGDPESSRSQFASNELRTVVPETPLENAVPKVANPPRPLFADPGETQELRPVPEGEEPKRLQHSAEAKPLPTERYRGQATLSPDDPRGQQQPRLTIDKIAPKNAVLGQPMIYHIFVKNVGTEAAARVLVQDRIPAGSELTGTIPQAEFDGKTLFWKLGTLKPGDERKISVRINPIEEGQIGSVATVSFVAEVAAATVVTSPNIKLETTVPETARIGETIKVQFTVTNNGDADAENVMLHNMLPKELQHPGGNDLEYEIGMLKAGEKRDIELEMDVLAAGRVVNLASVAINEKTTQEVKNTIRILESMLDLSRSGPKTRHVGRVATYVNKITNATSLPMQNLTVSEVIPAGLTFVEATDGQYDSSHRVVTWSVTEIPAGQSQDLKIKLLPQKPGDHQSVVRVSDSTGQSSTLKWQTHVAAFASLSVDIEPPAQPVTVGGEVPLKLAVRNRGLGEAKNVVLMVTVPEEFELVSAVSPVAYEMQSGKIVFAPLKKLGAQSQQVFGLRVQAKRSCDSRWRATIDAEHMREPLSSEEALLVLPADK